MVDLKIKEFRLLNQGGAGMQFGR